MNDFESTVKRLLNEKVDTTLGPHRPAPSLDVAAGRRRYRPWVVPLVAAACIGAATVAIVVPVKLFANRQAPALSPSDSTVRLGDATLRLPAGWVAREVADASMSDGWRGYSSEWCLAPARTAVASPSCPLQFGTGPAEPQGFPSPNEPAGIRSAPGLGLYCFDHDRVVDQQISRVTESFGNREAVHLQWHYRCGDGHVVWVEQYVIDTAPGFILFSDQMTSQLHSAMALIARYAAPPRQTGPLLLVDDGRLRSIEPQPDGGWRITITPLTQTANGWQPTGEPDRSYLVPRRRLALAGVGDKLVVHTNGTQVVGVDAEAGS